MQQPSPPGRGGGIAAWATADLALDLEHLEPDSGYWSHARDPRRAVADLEDIRSPPQFARTARSRAHARSELIRSAIVTDNGRVRPISSRTTAPLISDPENPSVSSANSGRAYPEKS